MLLQKILWQHKNKAQFIGASVGAFIGFLLMLLSLQIYADIRFILHNTKSDFITINKKVSILSTLGARTSFTEEEISQLRKQPFIKKVASYTSSNFQVFASSDRFGFSTLLFFQSLPDDFIDIDNSRFKWHEGADEVPIILSQDYLALYNFGFAPAQGLPPFSEGTITKVSFTLKLSDGEQLVTTTGRIIGFSKQFNSILVPQSFMESMNKRFAQRSEPSAPFQLVAETDNPYSKDLNDFLEKNGYDTGKGGLIGGELKALLALLVGILAVIGFIILLLSLLVFVLNFRLIIAEASTEVRLLTQIGYTQKSINRILTKNLLKQLFIIIAAVFIVLVVLKWVVSNWIRTQGIELTSYPNLFVLSVGLIFAFLFIGFNINSIQKSVAKLAN